MMKNNTNIRLLSEQELQGMLQDMNEPKFRAAQVLDWLWTKSATTFQEMTNLPKSLREKLDENFVIPSVQIHQKQVSNDGTIKLAFRLYDGNIVEGVLIPQNERMTACISSQVGCSLDCKFCATGKLKRVRNLTFDEIYDQVALIHQTAMENYHLPLTNIVYMGMGEPLLNYQNTIDSIDKITGTPGLGMSAKRITVSTAGIAKMIKKLAEDGSKVNLALSLHAPTDEKRSKIMSINETNNLKVLKEALVDFYHKTRNRVTFEYVMLKDFNDSDEDALALAMFCRNVPSKVNLIEYNVIEDGVFQKSLSDRTDRFMSILERNKVTVNLRRSRGEDIDAACGQLANKS